MTEIRPVCSLKDMKSSTVTVTNCDCWGTSHTTATLVCKISKKCIKESLPSAYMKKVMLVNFLPMVSRAKVRTTVSRWTVATQRESRRRLKHLILDLSFNMEDAFACTFRASITVIFNPTTLNYSTAEF